MIQPRGLKSPGYVCCHSIMLISIRGDEYAKSYVEDEVKCNKCIDNSQGGMPGNYLLLILLKVSFSCYNFLWDGAG